MKIKRTSIISGKESTMDLDVTESQLNKFLIDGEHIQNVFTHLSSGEREFIKSGIHPDEWDDVFGTESE